MPYKEILVISLTGTRDAKGALLLLDWTSGLAMEHIEQKYSANVFYAVEYGHVQRIASTTRFHLLAAAEIASVMFGNGAPDDLAIDRILRRLEVGLPEESLGLLDLPRSANTWRMLSSL